MAKAQLFKSMGDPPGLVACEVTYEVNYSAVDKLEPRVPISRTTRTQMTKAQLFKSMGNPGLPSECKPLTPYNPSFTYLSSEPSSVSARFGPPPNSNKNSETPVWKKIATKTKLKRMKEIEMGRKKQAKKVQAAAKNKLMQSANTISQMLGDSIGDRAQVQAWKTPLQASATSSSDGADAGSLDSFLLPNLSSESKLLRPARQSAKQRAAPTPQRWVKEWSIRHASEPVVVVVKPKPDELADYACKAHLATIERCQPTQWLSPYGGDDGKKHLHATQGTENKDWMGPEWLEEDKYGNVIEESLFSNDENSLLCAEASEVPHLLESVGVQEEESGRNNVESSDSSLVLLPPKKSTYSSNAIESSDSSLVLLPPKKSTYSSNAIARRSEFFGKCRIANKLQQIANVRILQKPGKMARLVSDGKKHTHHDTPRTGAIIAAYSEYIIPRPGLLGNDITADGKCDMSSRAVHAATIVAYLKRIHAAAVVSHKRGEGDFSPDIKHLSLNDTLLNDGQAAKIIRVLCKLQTIESLDLSNNKLGCLSAQALLEMLHECDTLVDLRLSGSLQASMATATLLNGWRADKLVRIDYSHNRVSSTACVRHVATLLTETKMLEHANFAWNNFGPKGGCTVARALESNTTLTFLSLAFNGLGEHASLILSKGLANHAKLMTLDMDGNNFEDICAVKLADAMAMVAARVTARKNKEAEGASCKLFMRHNKITSNVADKLMSRNAAKKVHKKCDITLSIYPVIVGDGEGSTDPTVSIVYQVPKMSC